jgi:cobalt-zinc-cadmium efflux system outer membrane protein
VFAGTAFGQAAGEPVKLTLDQAVELAIQHNHSLLAARTTIQQNLAQEVTANLRPNPTLFTDWEYLPLYKPAVGILDY